jgi:hypothetical protein
MDATVSIPVDSAGTTNRRWFGRRWGPAILGTVAVALAVITVLSLPYYLAPSAVRVRSPLNRWLAPSGYLGQTAGIVAFLIFLFLWMYPFRKKVRWLAFTGAVAKWLDVHVATAIMMPLIVGVHAGWRFEGLIGLGYGAILVVCASGVVGRYIYSRIPRSKTGVELDMSQVGQERRALLTDIAAATKLTPEEVEHRLATVPSVEEGAGLLRTFAGLARDDYIRWRAVRRFAADMSQLDRKTIRRVSKLASRESALRQQARMLAATQRVFRFWHVAHRPFAITALVAVVVHVVVVVVLGATWFW